MATSITIKTCYSTIVVEVDKDDMSFDEFFNDLVEVACSATYSREIVCKYLSENN